MKRFAPEPGNHETPGRNEGTMHEKEKYMAEIETRLKQFDDTFSRIKELAQERNVDPSQLKLHILPVKTGQARDQARQIQETEGNVWQTYQSELNNLVDDIDEDLRNALAYFG